MTLRRDFAGFIAAAALLGANLLPSSASADDFYKGKTVTITVGFTPGGGFDANARLIARFIGNHIPGSPTVIVVNAPGAASSLSVEKLDVNEPTDGTVMDVFNFGLLGDSLLRPDVTKIDFRKYAWIGSVSEDVTTCYVWHEDAPKTIDALKTGKSYIFGDAGQGASEDINTKILMRIFKTHITEATGYPGSAEVRLALERGEVDGDCGTWSSIPADWLTSPKFHPLLRTSKNAPEGMSPDVPYILDIAPDPHARDIIRFLVADGELGRPLIASQKVPADRVAILRAAFSATVKDPEFIAAAKTQRLPVSPRTGDEAEKIVTALYATPPDIIAAAQKTVAPDTK
jgi:tripartite-type tricarboxylate transporter receptor subunit TctC